jgi:hypothetical protein
MELLLDRDVGGLPGFLQEAAEVDGPDAFTEELVEAFWQLIPADHGESCNTFSGVDLDVAPGARSLQSFSEIGCDWCCARARSVDGGARRGLQDVHRA